jgi:hypothetical protein
MKRAFTHRRLGLFLFLLLPLLSACHSSYKKNDQRNDSIKNELPSNRNFPDSIKEGQTPTIRDTAHYFDTDKIPNAKPDSLNKYL